MEKISEPTPCSYEVVVGLPKMCMGSGLEKVDEGTTQPAGKSDEPSTLLRPLKGKCFKRVRHKNSSCAVCMYAIQKRDTIYRTARRVVDLRGVHWKERDAISRGGQEKAGGIYSWQARVSVAFCAESGCGCLTRRLAPRWRLLQDELSR